MKVVKIEVEEYHWICPDCHTNNHRDKLYPDFDTCDNCGEEVALVEIN